MTARNAMRTRVFAVAAAGALAVFAAGCGGGSDEEADGGSEQTVEIGGGGGSDDGGASDAGGASDDGGDADDDGASDGGGASDDGADQGVDAGSGDQPPADADLRETELPVDVEQAMQTATDAAGAGFVHQVGLDYSDDRGIWTWDIGVFDEGTEYEIDIDAVTGEVVSQEQESTDDTENELDLSSPMTYDDALAAALAERDGQLRGWTLDEDDGVWQYEFEIVVDGDDEDVTVDTDSGTATVDD